MSQSYPWFKFSHVEYLLDPMITSLSLAAQGANTRLMAYAARQLPFGTLPNDDKTLLAMSGAKTVKQWQKLYQELMGVVWFLGDDGRLYCPLMNVESVTQLPKQDDNQQDNSKPLTNAERCRRYRDSKKNVCDTNTDTSSDTQNMSSDTLNMSSDTTATRTQHDSDTTKSVDSVSFGGIKGGDLDLDLKQDLDLDQELKTKTTREASVCDARFDEFWIQYPRKENKQGAIKAFKKLKPSEKLFEEILLALSKQKTWPAFQNGYAPHAATWLNAKRWEDQPPINQTTSKPITGIFNGEESDLMRANRAAMAEAKKMLFGEEAA